MGTVTLPVKLAGLGVHSAEQLASFAFLASAAACTYLVIPSKEEMVAHWSDGHDHPIPDGIAREGCGIL